MPLCIKGEVLFSRAIANTTHGGKKLINKSCDSVRRRRL